MAKTPTPQLPQPTRISETELRKLFNEHVLPQVASGRVREQIMRGAGRHPSLVLANMPFCTESQQVAYIDTQTNEELARAHRYLLPDGTIGASGKPDPKRLYWEGKAYRIIKKKHR